MKRLPTRKEIDAKYKWQLEDIYATDELWESDFKKLKAMLPHIQKYKGKIDSAQAVYDVLKLKDDISMISEKLFTYARMRRDENNDNTVYQALADRAMAMIAEVQSELSFVVPELLSKPTEVLYKYIEEKEELKLYKRYIDELVRQKAHILSAEEERLLAMAGEVTEAPDTIFTMINDADIRFPVIKDENGEDIELTKGRYIQLLKSHDRRVRKDAYEALYDTYGKLKNTLATTYSYSVKKDIFYARVRKYNSSLEASLDDDNVPVSVYDGLIDAVNSNLGLLHRYMSLRKKILKLDQLAMYDVYVPLVKDVKKEIPYEEATNIVKNGLTPLGSEYIGLLEKGFNSKWIDVFENQGKTSGAYSWGCYGVHPYVLLNYQGALDDVFTLAHEMGHALHTYYSNSFQPYIYANYRIFVAEVASTLNEALLIHYLLEKTRDKNEKLYLINHYLEEFRGTVFRQTMFAEFEKIVHEKAESGIPLTPDLLCNIYKDLNAKYFGPDVITDDRIVLEWARIPHFYRSFYVYKYATSFSAAIAISQHILQEGKPAVDRYIEFLKSGSTDYPIELLKKAGVDMTTPQPVHDALKVFGELVEKMEQIEI